MHHVLHECVVGCPILSSTMSMSRSIIAAWASLFIAIMLFSMLRHPTCASYIAWMCCRMSNSIKHVWACPDQTLYIFLHSLRSNFSPSRPLQLWFEADCETSLARDIYAMFVCLFVFVVVDDKRERQNFARAYGTGVGARRGHRFLIAIVLLLVLRHPTCASCVAWMCCRMSNSIKHAWACPD